MTEAQRKILVRAANIITKEARVFAIEKFPDFRFTFLLSGTGTSIHTFFTLFEAQGKPVEKYQVDQFKQYMWDYIRKNYDLSKVRIESRKKNEEDAYDISTFFDIEELTSKLLSGDKNNE